MKTPVIRLALCLGIAGAAFAASAFASETTNEKAAQQLGLAEVALPQFPAYLQQIGITEGAVAVAISRAADGKVDDVLVLESTHPRFSEAVTEAVHKWRFAPPSPEQQPAEPVAPTIQVVRFQFHMGGAASVLMPTIYVNRPEMPARPDEIELTRFDELDTPPAARFQPMPHFPSALRRQRIFGSASVSFFVDTEGKVRVPLVTSATHPEFGDAALEAIKQWRFDTPRRNGRPVNAIETWTFNFGPQSGGRDS